MALRLLTLVAVYIFSSGRNTSFLLLRRRKGMRTFWQGVTGSVEDSDPSLVEAVKREVEEETGFSKYLTLLDLGHHFTYIQHGEEHKEHCFGMEVEGIPSPTLSIEHDAYEWLSYPDAVKRLLRPQDREALSILYRAV